MCGPSLRTTSLQLVNLGLVLVVTAGAVYVLPKLSAWCLGPRACARGPYHCLQIYRGPIRCASSSAPMLSMFLHLNQRTRAVLRVEVSGSVVAVRLLRRMVKRLAFGYCLVSITFHSRRSEGKHRIVTGRAATTFEDRRRGRQIDMQVGRRILRVGEGGSAPARRTSSMSAYRFTSVSIGHLRTFLTPSRGNSFRGSRRLWLACPPRPRGLPPLRCVEILNQQSGLR